ncbi:bone morphogenetic protein receptor type-2 [Phlebotomus argentipes]|uniref:bone morphogenetic protein receptor type-2 n=1 Tax=Phlebotomus argentipes TaxID=94469 RepID=UPI002892E795|nr:bone morphogenetic protein receptor type-2 [Phlebotomus argentipes]
MNAVYLSIFTTLTLAWLLCCTAAPQSRICVKSITQAQDPRSDEAAENDSSYEDDFGDDDEFEKYDIQQSNLASNYNLSIGTTICERKFNFCHALWRIDAHGNVTIASQGCWESDSKASCDQSECISRNTLNRDSNRYLFCCCSENLCNDRMTSVTEEGEDIDDIWASQSPSPAPDASILQNPFVWIAIAFACLIPLSVIIIVICKRGEKSQPELAPLAPSGPGYSSNLHNVDNLKLCAMIGQGKYGTVWRGSVNEQPVAVKIFPGQHKQYFINERDIYTLPIMDDCSLLMYFGCDERRTMEDNIEYLLVLSLAPLGCLQDWLTENTTAYAVFCSMAKSVAHGLAHMHTEMRKGDLLKPCICHRDLNSRNILVKADLTCVLCDFGFAMKTFGPRYEYRGEIALAETKSINEVGTLRYMAPEVLEGAVNLRDCESALKQIDVYALGLVLWELSTRCQDFYPEGQGTADYRAPYEAEVGKNPTYEQMQVFVSRHKARPLFPPTWGGGIAGKIIRETCEECWDQDAEARLTALCVEERLHELSSLRPKTTTMGSPPVTTNNVVNSLKSISPICPSDTVIITPPNQIIPKTETAEHTADAEGVRHSSHCRKLVESESATEVRLANGERKFNGWNGVRSMIKKKLFKRASVCEEKSHLMNNKLSLPVSVDSISCPEICQESSQEAPPKPRQRPSNLNLAPIHFESSSESGGYFENNLIRNSLRGQLKALESSDSIENYQRRGEHTDPLPARIVTSKSANAVKNLNDPSLRQLMLTDKQIKRQRSLEVFREVFGPTKGSVEKLRDPSQRVKTPGDVPPSVRKVRASKTLSLYDDRMMDSTLGNIL